MCTVKGGKDVKKRVKLSENGDLKYWSLAGQYLYDSLRIIRIHCLILKIISPVSILDTNLKGKQEACDLN